MRLREFHDEAAWIEAAASELLAAFEAARRSGRGGLELCLAGGLTPESVYRALSELPLAGPRVGLWLGDERAVPPGDGRLNASMVERAFSGCAWEPEPLFHPWPGAETEEEAIAACSAYAVELGASLGARPVFDLAFLGLGADGHTASVFPRDASVASRASAADFFEDGRIEPGLTAVTRSPLPPHIRMTLELGLLRASRRRVFLVKGRDKLPALRSLEAEDPSIPASFLAGPEALVLYLI
jgi:6-phosphogluconolactonase